MRLKRLKEMMELQGVSVEELAVKTLMSGRTIEKARKSHGMPINTCKRIANALRVKTADLE